MKLPSNTCSSTLFPLGTHLSRVPWPMVPRSVAAVTLCSSLLVSYVGWATGARVWSSPSDCWELGGKYSCLLDSPAGQLWGMFCTISRSSSTAERSLSCPELQLVITSPCVSILPRPACLLRFPLRSFGDHLPNFFMFTCLPRIWFWGNPIQDIIPRLLRYQTWKSESGKRYWEYEKSSNRLLVFLKEMCFHC